ncbi:hypothetical protein J7E79_07450 [Bacillus sp. ISL-40]|uniref:hypothetical protein n=1 Tax=unclassified Bacillus (in: firmicutes) TaxID=185979 RepID=UPI001BEBDC06|nr:MULTISPECIES: hypothetical protein [unclassified Bacillus (in: firmicutes)]MBT2697245.1 hypothetical protein [Bacillus sp. ISL-40]MBT2741198.1 hypothetical protein [Bacillus sp. ISL-77]
MNMLFFRRKNRIKVQVFYAGDDGYSAMASDGKLGVYNCYGRTKEAAKEMALYRLRKFQEKQRTPDE